jgi:hypothetical protein
MDSEQYIDIHIDRIAELDEEWANNSHVPDYPTYIKEKDIGLVFITASSPVCRFKVIDIKKYLLAKIKYGF